jgi:hypothetical protein
MTVDNTGNAVNKPASCQSNPRLVSEGLASHEPVRLPDAELNDDAEIARLAALSPIAYERERAATAKKLGMRAAMLDKVVAAARRDLGTRALPHGR